MDNRNFWENADFKDAHLAKLDLPEDIIQKLYSWWKEPRDILFFSGTPGVGKSYFLAALIHSNLETSKFPDWRYMNAKHFFMKLRQIMNQDWDFNRQIQQWCESDLFLFDDLGASQDTDWQKECFGSFLEERIQNRLPTVITSNYFLDDIKKLYHERIYSRLAAKRNTIIELKWHDKRQMYP